MAARLNVGRFLKDTKKYITPTIPYLNIASIRNGVSIHSFCPFMYKGKLTDGKFVLVMIFIVNFISFNLFF